MGWGDALTRSFSIYFSLHDLHIMYVFLIVSVRFRDFYNLYVSHLTVSKNHKCENIIWLYELWYARNMLNFTFELFDSYLITKKVSLLQTCISHERNTSRLHTIFCTFMCSYSLKYLCRNCLKPSWKYPVRCGSVFWNKRV